jgi:hypothetical protein
MSDETFRQAFEVFVATERQKEKHQRLQARISAVGARMKAIEGEIKSGHPSEEADAELKECLRLLRQIYEDQVSLDAEDREVLCTPLDVVKKRIRELSAIPVANLTHEERMAIDGEFVKCLEALRTLASGG